MLKLPKIEVFWQKLFLGLIGTPHMKIETRDPGDLIKASMVRHKLHPCHWRFWVATGGRRYFVLARDWSLCTSGGWE